MKERHISRYVLSGVMAILLCMAVVIRPAFAIDPDEYEVDDTYSQASVIDIDNTAAQSHNFHYSRDQDWTMFYGLSGTVYSIKTSNVGSNCDNDLAVYDSDGTTLLYESNDKGKGEGELLEFTSTRDGIYYVKVYECYGDYGENTEYDLRVYRPYAPTLDGFLEGTVQGPAGVIPYAVVVTDGGGSAVSRPESGAYSIFHSEGTYTVTVEADGYNSASQTGVVISADTPPVNFSLTPLASVSPDIKANGQDGPITISSTTPLSITVSLDPGSYAGKNADWWVAVSTPSGTFHYYNLSTGSMVPGLLPTHQGPLFSLGTTQLLNSSDLTAGTHTFYFGVDLNMNGSLDIDSIYYDWVSVNVTEQ